MSLKDLNDDEILEHLKKNTILRNKQLSVLIKLLNSFQDNTTIAIDGAWGSGKTVFVKQLRMLADKTVEDYGRDTLNDADIAKLRENQKLFYFNAWESDYLGDALSALLLKLIAADDEGFNEANIKRAFSMLDPAAMVKTVTANLVNIEGKRKKDRLVEGVKMLVDRHDAVNEFIDIVKGDSQRVVFVIDEVDRCKPSFAVDLLETIKHYFTRDDVTFILTTNVTELSHTIKKYYGHEFDGAGYLNKFFDYSYHLQKVDTDLYTRAMLDWAFNGGMVSGVAADAIAHFNFQMREINAYISALKLVDDFISSSRSIASNPLDDAFVKGLLVPFALALKVRNDSGFLDFVNGTEKGAQILRNFAEATVEMKDFTKQLELNNVNITSTDAEYEKLLMDEFIELYRNMFKGESMRNRTGIYLRPFQEAVSLLSSYTAITEPQESEE